MDFTDRGESGGFRQGGGGFGQGGDGGEFTPEQRERFRQMRRQRQEEGQHQRAPKLPTKMLLLPSLWRHPIRGWQWRTIFSVTQER